MQAKAEQSTATTDSAGAASTDAGPSAAALQRAAAPALDRMIAAADPTTATSPLPTDTHPFQALMGTAFVGKPGADISPTDVRQGEIGDCWLMAAMAAIARANPEAIRRLIHDRGDQTYDVTIFVPARGSNKKQAKVITVDSRVPISDGKPIYARSEDQGELWPALLEKAYATWAGSYAPLFEGRDSSAGLDALTADPVDKRSMLFRSKDTVLADLAQAYADHRPVVMASRTPHGKDVQRGADLGLVWPHAYSLESVDTSARTISVRNSDRDDSSITPTVIPLSIDDFDAFFDQYTIGPKLS